METNVEISKCPAVQKIPVLACSSDYKSAHHGFIVKMEVSFAYTSDILPLNNTAYPRREQLFGLEGCDRAQPEPPTHWTANGWHKPGEDGKHTGPLEGTHT